MFSRKRPLAVDQPLGSKALAPFALNGRYVAFIALARAHVAWSQVSHGTAQILKLDPGATAGSHVLDQGAGVDVGSLHLCAGSHNACWTTNGQQHSVGLD